MTPERWRQITGLFHKAAARPAADRAAFLSDACTGDAALRQDVEALLAQASLDAGFFDDPRAIAGAFVRLDGAASLIGRRLGPYEVTALLGAGGMGEVYKARDTRLGRDVALKTLPRAFTTDKDRLARFEREARLLATLNDPHIATLYGFENTAVEQALVMELVEGPTLADRIARGPLPLDEALPIAKQIAEALEAAHERGIVHRDLKPANIKVRPDGVVKVLDFGLAKALEPAFVCDSTASPTITSPAMTRPGAIIGTAAYMAPEQARGRPADQRSDLWSFGCVLYEMLTGEQAFDGVELSDALARILTTEPDWTKLPSETPGSLRRLLHRCLEKDRKRRLDSAADARLEIEDAVREPTAEIRLPRGRPAVASIRLWQGCAALMALFVVGLAGWARWSIRPGSTSRFEAALPEGTLLGDYVSVSPDGRKLVVAAAGSGGFWMREFESLDWRHLPGTEDGESPFWSPDSRYLAFAVNHQVKKVDTTGGPPETLCTVPSIAMGSGAWNRDGTIIFGSWGGGSGGPVWKVSEAGGPATPVTEVDIAHGELYHTWPVFLEDGRHFLYFRSGPADVEGVYVGSVDAPPRDQSRERILASRVPAAYANGYLFIQRGVTVTAQPFDNRSLRLKDAPVPVADGVRATWFGTSAFAVSPGGALAFQSNPFPQRFQLTWIDRRGKIVGTLGPPSPQGDVTLSPDGTRGMIRDAGYDRPGDLWTVDLSTGQHTRFTFRNDAYSPGVWSPDATRVAYAGGNLGDTLYEKNALGNGNERELLREPGIRHYVTSWSRDGRFLLYHTENTPKTGADVWVLPLEGDRKPVLLLGEPFNEWAAQFSPDMRWIVYASLETGGLTAELFVRPFTVSASGVPALGEGKWQLSKDGNWPVWRAQNEILFSTSFTMSGQAVVAASVTTSGTTFASRIPQELFPALQGAIWNVTKDDQRFLFAAPQGQRANPVAINVVLNWPALLNK